jgi:hypothetical protein
VGELRSAEQYWSYRRKLADNMRFADDARQFLRVVSEATVWIDAIRSSDAIEPFAQVQKDQVMPTGATLPSRDAANEATRITIVKQPPIGFRLLVEQIN